MTPLCPCGSEHPLSQCCGRYHAGTPAPDAERLMRSRYSAYALGLIDYLQRTTLPVQQAGLDSAAIAAWSQQSQWLGLEVSGAEQIPGTPAHAWVTFTARWRDSDGDGEHAHQERSAFVQVDGHWYFIDPSVPLKASRNDPCPCAGGQKFKKCCASYLT